MRETFSQPIIDAVEKLFSILIACNGQSKGGIDGALQDDMSRRLLPVQLEEQLVPDSFAHAPHPVIDLLDLSSFDAYFFNDSNGAPTHSRAMPFCTVLNTASHLPMLAMWIDQPHRETDRLRPANLSHSTAS